jgi:hypothetical protein
MALTTNFTSDRDVERWVERYGIDALRDLVYTESMRSSSQYWGSTWLARHAAPAAGPSSHAGTSHAVARKSGSEPRQPVARA